MTSINEFAWIPGARARIIVTAIKIR